MFNLESFRDSEMRVCHVGTRHGCSDAIGGITTITSVWEKSLLNWFRIYLHGSLVTGPSKRGNKNPKDFLDRGPGETEFKLVGNPL